MTAPPADHPAKSSQDAVRLERDRHVAFAFAAADLLLEADAQGVIVKASGAAQSIVGVPVSSLRGVRVEDLSDGAERAFVRRLFGKTHEVGRVDPLPVDMTRPDGTSTRVLLGACQLPNLPSRVFLSVTVLPSSLAMANLPRDENTGLLTQDGLRARAEQAARNAGQTPARLKLLKLEGLEGAVRQLPPDRAALMMEEVAAALRAQSVGGDAAGSLGGDDFGIVTTTRGDDSTSDAALMRDLGEVFRSVGVREGQISTHLAQLDLSAQGLSDDELGRAVTYAMNAFVKSEGKGFGVKSLAGGLAAAVKETVDRVASTRKMIEEGTFTLAYQPVVTIKTGLVHHYEALSRFSGGKSTFETISFSEDVGLVAALDIAVCKQALEALRAVPSARVAVNLSGLSIQTESFRQSFSELIRPLNDLRGNLLFELTESASIDNLEEAATFLRWLRKLGHQVCLDDFGAGAAAYSYLRQFDVDFVKIDGPFLNAALEKGRERALIRSICVLCAELGCKVIGEMIEDQKMSDLALSLGIDFGQGWLYGKPLSELPKPVKAAHRKGVTESWS